MNTRCVRFRANGKGEGQTRFCSKENAVSLRRRGKKVLSWRRGIVARDKEVMLAPNETRLGVKVNIDVKSVISVRAMMTLTEAPSVAERVRGRRSSWYIVPVISSV